jgi:hypothetical protein
VLRFAFRVVRRNRRVGRPLIFWVRPLGSTSLTSKPSRVQLPESLTQEFMLNHHSISDFVPLFGKLAGR